MRTDVEALLNRGIQRERERERERERVGKEALH